MVWGLFTKEGEALPSRTFSSGVTQEDTLNEIVELFRGNDIVFMQGAVGSGKSIIGATIAGYFGNGIINVPLKPLQDQYLKDFTERFNITLKKLPLEIKILKGRDNFGCIYKKGLRASDWALPCTKRLERSETGDGDTITETRWKVAKTCPYWSPIYAFPPSGEMMEELEPRLVREYTNSLGGTNYHIMRREGCEYCQQNNYYGTSDILVYNSSKWVADTIIARKPKVEVEIFDEADNFLDSLILKTSLTGRRIIFLERLCKRLKRDLGEENAKRLDLLFSDIKDGFENTIRKGVQDTPSEPGEDQEQLLKDLLKLVRYLDDERLQSFELQLSRLLDFSEILIFYTDAQSINFFVPRPDVVLKDYLEKSAEKLLFMSATLQDPSVLKEVYGLEDFGYVIGEPKMPGRIIPKRIGTEKYVTYRNWQMEGFKTRYFRTFSELLERASRPTLVQIHAYKYLPEKEGEYPPLPSRETLKNLNQDEEIEFFTLGGSDVLFSTKTDRGIDLPDEKCRSIILQKYPYPNRYDPVLVALEKRFEKGAFDRYYKDIAYRNFIQQIGRGLRHKEDWIEVWSPDLIVHSNLRKVLRLTSERPLESYGVR